ncbi:MAG: hypothetical protein IIC67_10225 [Thaumarchaeota archaeon]|nr:hypothetical protein [Nitrososphaerota archaeon]
MDFEKLCKNILELDSKIRFTGVVNTKGVLIINLEQKGVDQFLSPDELKMSIHYSMWEWEKSQNLSHELGFEKSSVLEYDKVTLISIPIDKSNLFVASIEPNEDYFKMISKIQPIIQNFSKE